MPLARYGLAALWAIVPLVAGPGLAAALDTADQPFRGVASIALWAVWALTLLAALVPRPATLTVVRIVMPGLLVAGAWAVLATPEPGWRDVLCLTTGALVTVIALSAAAGASFVDGASYGTERRFGLRPPGFLLLGPIELAWVVTVAGALGGPLLLLSQHWVAGAIATLVGWPAAWFALRALSALARRCVVFVPAGLVVVDPMNLADPMPLQRGLTESIRVAPANTSALDAGGGALGMAIEIRGAEPLVVSPLSRRRQALGEPKEVDSLLISPSRPGALLAEASNRGFPVD